MSFSAESQTRVIPAEPQSKPILLRGGVAHIGNGEVIENSLIGFENGRLSLVANATNVRVDVSGYDVIDINGKHVYPGFIIMNSRLGIEEVGSIDMTQDFSERGSVNPNVRTIIAYNTDSEIIPTFRYTGILMAQVAPSSGLVAGSSSIVQLDAWNWEDASYVAEGCISHGQGKNYRHAGGRGKQSGEKMKTMSHPFRSLKICLLMPNHIMPWLPKKHRI